MEEENNQMPEGVSGKTEQQQIIEEFIKERKTGKQPVIEIYGHPFYVDIHWGLLRPKDDFTTLGIEIHEIENWYNDKADKYWVPYDPKTRAIAELDFNSIFAIPKDILIVEIPLEKNLDPYGYARKYCNDMYPFSDAELPKMFMKAAVIPWEKTQIDQIIDRNLKKGQKEVQSKKVTSTRKKKGRHL